MADGQRERVVRVVLPVDLIKRLDRALLERLGGFESRAEFIGEAVENMLAELSYGPALPEPESSGRAMDLPPEGREELSYAIEDRGPPRQRRLQAETYGASESDLHRTASGSVGPTGDVETDLSFTILSAPEVRGLTFNEGLAEVEDGPLFGLHNRDYPSLWALRHLTEISQDVAPGFDDYLEQITRRAWSFAEKLEVLQRRGPFKLTVMFPRNREKPQSSEDGFKSFAVGGVTGKSNPDSLPASGPLFAWKACQLRREDGLLKAAPTETGYEMLEKLDGLSLELPHAADLAERFLEYLGRYAPGDLWGFKTVLEAVSEEPDREGLLGRFREVRPDWSEAMVSTNSQGYLGRGREWGLIEPKMKGGRYSPTPFGERILKDWRS